jgi:ribosome biogenesis GTPase
MNDYIKQMQKHSRKQKLRDARRKNGSRVNAKKPRQKKISLNEWDDWNDLDQMVLESYEPIISKAERERRREVETSLQITGDKISRSDDNLLKHASAFSSGYDGTALVVESGSGICRVDLDGELLLCDIRGNVKEAVTGYINPVAVGDQVVVRRNSTERGVIEAVLPRRSVLARPYSPDQGIVLDDVYQIVVANVDQLLIVTSWREPHIWPALIDRYLIAAQRNQIKAIICVNKIDLIEEPDKFSNTIQPYLDLNFPVLTTSVVTGDGIEDVRQQIKGKATVLAGLSGVGKSSILSAVKPVLNLKTGHVSQHGLYTGQGRHTTTQSSLLKLDRDTIVIDTPGVRAFGLAGIEPAELSNWYPEMVELMHQCKYRNCLHIQEPNCAVRKALEGGAISELRYKNYAQIIEELSTFDG